MLIKDKPKDSYRESIIESDDEEDKAPEAEN